MLKLSRSDLLIRHYAFVGLKAQPTLRHPEAPAEGAVITGFFAYAQNDIKTADLC